MSWKAVGKCSAPFDHVCLWNAMAPSLNCLSGFRERATRCFVKETTPSTAKDSGGYWLFLRKAGEIGPCAHSCARLISVLPSEDRKSTRLNSSHVSISYAVFCLKKKKI